jgi:hypothetical protein
MVVPRKKRKYTRKKKYNFWLYSKKIIKIFIILLIAHIIFINWKILFSWVYNSDLLVITWDNKQNSNKLSGNLENKVSQSIELFKNNSAKKILILWDKNIFKIDEVALIKNKISQNDIWEGNIAYQNSSMLSYPKNTNLFLEENDWNNIILVSDFWDYYNSKFQYTQKISENNIQVIAVYVWILDSIWGIFKNYYYYWKI